MTWLFGRVSKIKGKVVIGIGGTLMTELGQQSQEIVLAENQMITNSILGLSNRAEAQKKEIEKSF